MNPIENLKDLIVYQSQNNETISVEVNTTNYHLKEIFATHDIYNLGTKRNRS